MYKKIIVLLLCALAFGCGEQKLNTVERDSTSQQLHTFMDLLSAFEQQAQQLLTSLQIGSDVSVIKAHSDTLSFQAQTILALFVEQQPQCSDYVARLLPLSNSLQSLPYESIRSQLKQNEQLSQFESAICYHVKDLLMQPIMLSAWANEEGLKEAEYQLASESIVELIAHLSLVQTITMEQAHSPDYS
ncbi:hypothetical protein [Pseudoalteromonas sp. MMG022]|uniref:hypothetical protein n=1 Tax=Pseudoalteromonas sp. MMG022 TaxID=2909978 RepID=UPI001F249288|nr:hypothetical protein [Pseudoalteromonas sp. MMG022]MCF6435503.1 hypothetical protein [Pseudoalteromonas sp. MMG022]